MAQRRAVWTAWVVGGLAVTVAGAQPAADDQGLGDLVGLRVMLGGQTAQSTPWAGTLSVTPGRLVTVEGERFQGQDKVETTGQFSFSTHRRQLTGAQARRQQGQVQPFEPNGFRLTVADTTPESRLTLHAGDRDVTAPLAEVLAQGLNRPRFGIHIEALAPAQRVTAGQDYDDDPAAAVAPDGTIYAAFVRFTPAEAYRQRVQQHERRVAGRVADGPDGQGRVRCCAHGRRG